MLKAVGDESTGRWDRNAGRNQEVPSRVALGRSLGTARGALPLSRSPSVHAENPCLARVGSPSPQTAASMSDALWTPRSRSPTQPPRHRRSMKLRRAAGHHKVFKEEQRAETEATIETLKREASAKRKRRHQEKRTRSSRDRRRGGSLVARGPKAQGNFAGLRIT